MLDLMKLTEGQKGLLAGDYSIGVIGRELKPGQKAENVLVSRSGHRIAPTTTQVVMPGVASAKVLKELPENRCQSDTCCLLGDKAQPGQIALKKEEWVIYTDLATGERKAAFMPIPVVHLTTHPDGQRYIHLPIVDRCEQCAKIEQAEARAARESEKAEKLRQKALRGSGVPSLAKAFADAEAKAPQTTVVGGEQPLEASVETPAEVTAG